MHVVLAGGGTAGHIEPALNTADALKREVADCTVSFLGTERGLELRLVPARGYELAVIPPVPLPRRPNLDLLTLPARLLKSVSAVRKHLRAAHADVVVGFGGYVALPAYLAAKLERIPVVVHEANAKAGLANRVGARFAAAVVETVSGSLPNALNLGLPLRSAIVNLDRSTAAAEGRALWRLADHRPVLLVFGGSQGARRLNEVTAAAADELVASGFQILHSVGLANEDQLRHDLPGYVTVTYIERMDLAYAVASAALCRAGAMTVAELTAVGLPAIYVPLPIGNGEQRLNALPVVARGGGVVVDNAEVSARQVVDIVSDWFEGGLEGAAAAAKSCGRPDAAGELVQVILKAARR